VWKEGLLRLANRISVLAFWPATAVIVWGELVPRLPSQLDEIGDKWQHFIAYLGLAGMAVLALGWRSRLVWALAGIVALGGVLEILQVYTGRDPEFWDFIADTAGAVAGALAGWVFLLAMRPARLVGVTRPD
jgi:VanZ family protein